MLAFITVLVMSLVGVEAQRQYFMDQPSGCGVDVRVGQAAIFVHGRSKVVPGNPLTSCVLKLRTDSADSKYKLEVTIESLTINDCSIKLEIFDHNQDYGQHLRSIGCGSKSTDTLYSSGQFITLKLTRPLELYQPDYDYTLSIKSYGNDDVIGGSSRVNRIGVELVIPLIIGVLLLIFVAVILCCCYRQGRLPGMHGRKPRKSASMSSVYEKRSNGGIDNPVISAEKSGFNPQNPIVWSTLASADSSKDPVTGRQRGRSALMSQSIPVPPPSAPPPAYSGQMQGRQSENYSRNGYSPQNSKRLYHKNDSSRSSQSGPEIQGRNVDSYLESKGVKIDIYPDDSLKRRNMGSEGEGRKRGSYAEAQGNIRDFDDKRKRGSYAEAQERSRGSYAEEGGRKRGSYTEAQGKEYAGEHVSRREGAMVYAENEKNKGRKGSSPSRRSSSPGGRGTSPSRRGTSPNRQGSSSPGRRRSPGEKRRTQDQSREKGNADAPPEGKLKRPSSGFFDNPDEEGYIYSYDHLYPGDDDVSGSTQPGESPNAKRRQGRRGSAAVEFEEDEDGYLLVHNDNKSKPSGKDKAPSKRSDLKTTDTKQPQSDGTSYETIEMNPGQNAKLSDHGKGDTSGKRGSSMEKGSSQSPSKKSKIPELEDRFDENARYSSVDELSEPTESETITNPLHSNPAVKTRLVGSNPLGDAESKPARKKKSANLRKNGDDNVSEAGSVRYGIPPSAMNGNHDPRERLDSYPYTVGPSAIAPQTTESMGPHGQSFISAFENRAPSTHNSPAHVAGKAAWYVQTTPSRKGPVTHGTFVMQTTSRQPSQEELENGRRYPPYGEQANKFPDHIPSDSGSAHRPLNPASSSTPNSNNPRSTFNTHQHFSPIEKAERTPDGYGVYKSYPRGRGYDRNPDQPMQYPHDPNSYPGNATDPKTALVRNPPHSSQTQPIYADPGTSIFDEPGHRAAVMRSGIDPNTGNEVNQVVWTDTIPDPTDPVGPNPAVSRKTITRITTRAGHGEIPDPDSMTSQLSFQTYADRLAAPQANDPAFLSPSTAHQRYGGNPTVPEPAHGQEYPGEDNVAFYLGLKGQSSATARVHQPQARNHAIRDKISFPAESVA